MATRILMVTPDYPNLEGHVRGGVGAACHSLVQALKRIRDIHTTVLVAPMTRHRGTHAARPTPSEDPHQVVRLPFHPHRSHAADVLWRHARLVADAIASIPHDVLHVHDMATVAATRSDDRVILTPHGIAERDVCFRGNPHTRRLRSVCMRMLHMPARRKVPNLIAINPYVREAVRPRPSQRVWDVPNAVLPLFFTAQRQPQRGRILLVGRIIPLKNVEGAIRCLARVASGFPSAHLRIAGDGEQHDVHRCRTLAQQLGIADRVSFLGSLTAERLCGELELCHFLLTCSFQESAPMAIAEAMAAGVPVVARSAGGIRFMVRSGETGYVAMGADDAHVIEGMRQMLQCIDRANEMGSLARRVAEQTYHPDVVGQQTYRIYSEVVGLAGLQ